VRTGGRVDAARAGRTVAHQQRARRRKAPPARAASTFWRLRSCDLVPASPTFRRGRGHAAFLRPAPSVPGALIGGDSACIRIVRRDCARCMAPCSSHDVAIAAAMVDGACHSRGSIISTPPRTLRSRSSWQCFVFRNGDSTEGFLVREDGDYGIARVPGVQAARWRPARIPYHVARRQLRGLDISDARAGSSARRDRSCLPLSADSIHATYCCTTSTNARPRPGQLASSTTLLDIAAPP
jgi:hypothetical protein